MRLVTNEEAEAANFVICIAADEPTPFTDNEFGACSKCGRAVQFRPHAPKRPPKLCPECFEAMLPEQPMGDPA